MTIRFVVVVWQVNPHIWLLVNFVKHVFDCQVFQVFYHHVWEFAVKEIFFAASQNISQELYRALSFRRQEKLPCKLVDLCELLMLI